MLLTVHPSDEILPRSTACLDFLSPSSSRAEPLNSHARPRPENPRSNVSLDALCPPPYLLASSTQRAFHHRWLVSLRLSLGGKLEDLFFLSIFCRFSINPTGYVLFIDRDTSITLVNTCVHQSVHRCFETVSGPSPSDDFARFTRCQLSSNDESFSRTFKRRRGYLIGLVWTHTRAG